MDKKEVFKSFISTHDVLVVDKNASSRNRLLKTVCDLGCKRNTVHTCGTMAEAEEIINTKNVGIVLSDYVIGGGSGFDLFKMVREKKSSEKKDLCLILVTSNISQTAVAKAAEEDVDSFIIKPYTVQSIQENLLSTISAKISPSPYIVKIEEAKTQIFAGKYDEAMTILNVAMKLHPKPALALFYLGQAELLKSHVSQAEGNYSKGLSYNNIHYKCLIGLYELFMKQNKYTEAYQVVKKVAKYFPANPDRLTQVVRLTMQTQNYEDMQEYYDIFTQLDERTPQMTNFMGAGMYISGKYCFQNNKEEMGLKFFDNVAVSCSEHTKFIKAMISVLVDYNKAEDAMKMLSRFPAGSDKTPDYMISDFIISAKMIDNPGALVKTGLDLYNQNIRDYQVMVALIEAMEKSGHKQDKLQEFKDEVKKLWPEKAAA
jgi:CheY-like chemotaxis protein